MNNIITTLTLLLVASIASAQNVVPLKETYEITKAGTDFRFEENGISFMPHYVDAGHISYMDPTKRNYTKRLDWKPGERLFVNEGDQISVFKHFGATVITSLSKKEFIVSIAYISNRFGDNTTYYLLYPENEEVAIRKLGQTFIPPYDHHNPDNPRPYPIYASFMNDMAKNTHVVFTVYEKRNDITLGDTHISAEIPKSLTEHISQYSSLNDNENSNIEFFRSYYGPRGKIDYFYAKIPPVLLNYIISFLDKPSAAKSSTENEIIQNAKYKLSAPVQPAASVRTVRTGNLDATSEAKEAALKAFDKKYKGESALKRSAKQIEIPTPTQSVYKELTLKEDIDNFAPAGTAIQQVEMFSSDNELICVAWIKPKTPENPSSDPASNVIFILEPVQALIEN